MSNIVLSSGVRQNLLALQTTADLMSLTQNRLATGKKVNSALDNPGNYFTSSSLNNRASDLNALLDSIGQAQQTLRAADTGLTSLTKLVESAKSIAKQAQQAPQPGSTSYNAFTVAPTANPADEVIGVEDAAGAFGAAAAGGDAGNLVIDIGGTDYTIALAAGNTLANFVTTFNNTAGLGPTGAITASDNGGTLRLTANNADVDFTIDATSTAATLTKLQLTSGAVTNSTSLLDNIGSSGQTLTIQVNGGANQVVTFGTGAGEVSTVAEWNTKIGTLSGVTGSATQAGTSFTVASSTSVQNSLQLTASNAGLATALGIAQTSTTQGTATVGSPNATRTSLEADFNNVLSQIDKLAQDASYNGINLLNGDDLKVLFNETGASFLNITGVTYNAAGLGLGTVSSGHFQADGNLDATIGSLDTALVTLRTQAGKFGANLTTVQTRQDFTKNIIATLKTGADNLVLADTNEEGANLLALQTRQQLSTTALSLSAQADQAVLRLFG
jgi:flagellin-like hook-associated protein FlgL